MKHYLRFACLALLALTLVLAFVACGEEPAPTPTPDDETQGDGTTPTPDNPDVPDTPVTPEPDPSLKNIEGITFESATYDYDGTEQVLLITGTLPEGVSVSYTQNKGTNAGTYKAVATLSGEGYNTLVLKADLVINKLNYDLSQVAWDYTAAFTYTGAEFGVTVSGLPEGVTLTSYTDATATNAGSYTAKANVSYDTVNHNAPVIPTCAWTINPAPIVGISFEGATVEYDTYSHGISIVGNIPAGATVEYLCNGQTYTAFTAIEVGTYDVTAKISSPNHITLTISATLKITSTEEQLYLAVLDDGTIIFQNNLDGNKLYSYNAGTLKKLNSDVGQYLFSTGSSVYYISNSLLGDAIKEYNGTSVSKLYTTQAVKENAQYLTTDGTYLYYAVNNTLVYESYNGIFKIALDGSMEAPVRISTAKAAYLNHYNGKLYFSNLSEGKKLYSVSVNSTDSAGTMLWDEKVEYMIGDDDGNLYFNSTNGLLGGSAIRKYVISSAKCIKLTTDAGQYLTKVGSYIYYVNNDLATGFLFGKNICKVSADSSSDSILPGTKVLTADDNGFSSLSSDGTNLYYYKLNNKHLYCYDVSVGAEIDLMAGFVPPADPTTLSGYAKIAEYNGEIYYTNPLESGVVLKYNPTTKTLVKVLDDSVSGIYFHDGYMYFSTYVLTNYALWKMDLSTNIPVKLISDRCDYLHFTDDYIYYVDVGSAYNNHVMRMDYNGENVEEVYADKNLYIADVQVVNNVMYFVINPMLGKKSICKVDLATNEFTKLDIVALTFTVSGDRIYYYDNDSSLKSCNLSGGDVKTLVSNVEINDMIVFGGKLYFSSTSSARKGFFRCDLNGGNVTSLSSKNADALTVINGKLYFIQTAVSYQNDYPSQASGNDGHLYYLDGTIPVKQA